MLVNLEELWAFKKEQVKMYTSIKIEKKIFVIFCLMYQKICLYVIIKAFHTKISVTLSLN